MSSKLSIDVGKTGISGLIAQANTPLALEEWFDSSEDRVYVVKFSDYCAYMAMYEAENRESIMFARAHKIMELLTVGKMNLSKKEVDKVIRLCYSIMIRHIGLLLVREACLLARKDSDWVGFNISIALPICLKNYFGVTKVVGINNVIDSMEFMDIIPSVSVNDVLKCKELIDLFSRREDISIDDANLTVGTPLEDILVAGISYIKLSNMYIKGRIVGE